MLDVLVATVFACVVADVGRAATPSPGVLLSSFQPVTVLHPDEPFPPVSVDPFLATAQLEQRLADGMWSAVSEQPQGVLPIGDPTGCSSSAGSACWRLNIPVCTPMLGLEALPCYQDDERKQTESNVVYGAVLRAGGESFWSTGIGTGTTSGAGPFRRATTFGRRTRAIGRSSPFCSRLHRRLRGLRALNVLTTPAIFG
jgi:hypothetical protein